MRKITLLFALSLLVTSMAYAQSSEGCQKTCTVERVLYKDAFLGIKMYGPCESKQEKGAIIREVVEGTVAANTMLQESDVITYLNDVRIHNNIQMAKAIKALQPNQLVNIAFRRGDKHYNFDVRLGARHKEVVLEEVCCESPITVDVHPNPVKTSLSLAVNTTTKAKIQYQLSSMKGVIVKAGQLREHTKNLTETQIGVEDLPDGIYILKVYGNNVSVTKKIVVKH